MPFLFVAPLLSGWPFVVVLAVGGFLLQSTLPVNVTFAQTLAPISAATVSSLMMGFAWGTGGLAVPLVGLLADRIGIEHTLVDDVARAARRGRARAATAIAAVAPRSVTAGAREATGISGCCSRQTGRD